LEAGLAIEISRVLKTPLFLALALFVSAGDAAAMVQVRVNLCNERMYVSSPEGRHVWKVSTARSGYHTPKGSYAPIRLERMHYSRKYHTHMPYAIFFRGGYAIHGEYHSGSIGRPVSHGCVRLKLPQAALLYRLVKDEGARIEITGTPHHGRG
jgi:lipoprotein-anchoring transpeptidase ErfK/SrfK